MSAPTCCSSPSTAIRARSFRFFSGMPTRPGAGAGAGCNRNYPLPWGTGFGLWSQALEDACGRLEHTGRRRWSSRSASIPSRAIRSPVSSSRATIFSTIGARIAALGLPTLFVMEGGYAVAEIGRNAVNVLTGFEQAA